MTNSGTVKKVLRGSLLGASLKPDSAHREEETCGEVLRAPGASEGICAGGSSPQAESDSKLLESSSRGRRSCCGHEAPGDLEVASFSVSLFIFMAWFVLLGGDRQSGVSTGKSPNGDRLAH